MVDLAGCVRGTRQFPHIELQGAANEVLLLHGTSVANAANVCAGVFGVACGGVGANLVLPWPTSSARPTVVPCWLSLWVARDTASACEKWYGVGAECRMPSHRQVL